MVACATLLRRERHVLRHYLTRVEQAVSLFGQTDAEHSHVVFDRLYELNTI